MEHQHQFTPLLFGFSVPLLRVRSMLLFKGFPFTQATLKAFFQFT